FIKADLIESVIVLPSKLFYGNSVPGCLVVLNKHKVAEHKDKILLIWASRHFQSENPQNLLRRVDCMRSLVPWQAFGDLDRCRALVPEHDKALVGEIQRERDDALAGIEAAYGSLLAVLPVLGKEIAEREALQDREVPEDKEKRKAFREEKK